VYDQSGLTANDKARNHAHIPSTVVQLY